MDHKRGHGSAENANESTRVKRHKDINYQQPSSALESSQKRLYSTLPVVVRNRHISAEFDQRDNVQLASLERLRAIADSSAQCVDKLCGCSLQSNIEKSVEEVIYEEYLPIVLSQIVSRSEQSSTLPLLLNDKNAEIQCAICPDEKRFKGWEALLIHAAKFQKGNNHQHRGYYRAVREALTQSTNENLALPDIDQAPTSPKNSAYKDINGRWQQPIVIMDKQSEKSTRFGPHSKDPQLQEVLAVYNIGQDNTKKKVVVIPASDVGYINEELLEKQSKNSLTNKKPEDYARSQFMEGRWPGAKMCKYMSSNIKETIKKEEAVFYQHKENNSPVYNHLKRTLALGQPSSPREKSYNFIGENKQVFGLKDELRLNKPLEENRHIFDEVQFDSKVNAMVTRWKKNFKGFGQDQSQPLTRLVPGSVEYNRRYFMKTGPIKKGLEKDEEFKNQVDRYALLNPSSRNQVKKQLSVLEEQLRKNRLMWLQEVETVRQQFQHMADAVHDEQVERDAATMRIEKHLGARMKNMDEQQLRKKEYYMARKVISLHNCKHLRREADMKGLMDLWREEQRGFERECTHARFEKEKLESLHQKIHVKAHLSRKNHCPICLKKLNWPPRVSDLDLEDTMQEYDNMKDMIGSN